MNWFVRSAPPKAGLGFLDRQNPADFGGK